MKLFRKASPPPAVADGSAPPPVLPPAPLVTCQADGVLAYHLFLGRAPETDEAAGAFVGMSLFEMAGSFLGSEEFTTRILSPVAQTGQPAQWDGGLPAGALATGLTSALRIDAALVLAARDWAERLGALLEAPLPRDVLVRLHGEAASPLLRRADAARLALRARLTGEAEALRQLRATSEGLEIIATRDIVADDGGLRSLSDDPVIMAAVEAVSGPPSMIRRLTLSFADGMRPSSGEVKIYFGLDGRFEKPAPSWVRSADKPSTSSCPGRAAPRRSPRPAVRSL